MTTEQHLAWLLTLLEPPYTNGWWEFVKGKARDLAASDPAHAELPALVMAERERIKEEAMRDKDTSISGEATQ